MFGHDVLIGWPIITRLNSEMIFNFTCISLQKYISVETGVQ